MQLTADDLHYSWREREALYPALQAFNGRFSDGIPHILCGASGSGKTTLGLLLAGLKTPDRGRVQVNGEDMIANRRRAALVFQFPETLFFTDSVREEFCDMLNGQELQGVERLFMDWGIDFAEIAEKNPFQLSAGYARLVAIALQIVREPDILILDEPTMGLDEKYQRIILAALKQWIRPQRILIVITHDSDVIAELDGHIWALCEGQLAWSGRTTELLSDEQRLRRFSLLA